MKTLSLKGVDGLKIACYQWDDVEKPIGVVQIIHGMQEHARRYSEFARFLNSKGFIVFASDLRGHGSTAIMNNLPFGYSDGDIFMEIVSDQMVITDYLRDTFHLPVSIFAHSFGSFIAQRYMIENSFKIKNVVLSGTTYTNSFKFRLGYHLSNFCKIFRGKKRKAKFIEKQIFGGFGKNFKDGNWLSRDDLSWYKYTHDALCGLPFPNNFYYSMFKNCRKNYKDLKNIPYYLPILIIAGTDDPVSGEKGVFKLFVKYGEGKKRVFLKAYLNARHELLSETNREEVFNDVSDFMINDKIEYISISVS